MAMAARNASTRDGSMSTVTRMAVGAVENARLPTALARAPALTACVAARNMQAKSAAAAGFKEKRKTMAQNPTDPKISALDKALVLPCY